MLCPESSLALLAGIKTWNFTVWYKCKRKSGDCSLQRKINVNLIFEGSAGPEFTESTNSPKVKFLLVVHRSRANRSCAVTSFNRVHVIQAAILSGKTLPVSCIYIDISLRLAAMLTIH